MYRLVSVCSLVVLAVILTGRVPKKSSGEAASIGANSGRGRQKLQTQRESLLFDTPPFLTAFLQVEERRSAVFGGDSIPLGNIRSANFPREKTLQNIQRAIRPSEALLSIHTGQATSYLWAVTRNHFEFHRLAPEIKLLALARQFRSAVEHNAANRDELGAGLYQSIFGGLSANIERKPQWLILADDALFDTPFAALAVGKKKGNPVYLMEKHSTLRMTSALLVTANSPLKPGSFLGVGDGVYNTADARWTARGLRSTQNTGYSAQLPSLPGSRRELEACAREWRSGTPVLLTGFNASTASFETAVEANPAVIHIAAHVVGAPADPEQAVIRLGLAPSGQSEVIDQNEIAKYHLSGSTVVMNGCGSAALAPIPGTAISGLTRAWLKAGARAVIGSRWATPDDTGEIFQAFYGDLRIRCDRSAESRVVGASLTHAQQVMLRSHTWRSNPSYWAAFYVAEKE